MSCNQKRLSENEVWRFVKISLVVLLLCGIISMLIICIKNILWKINQSKPICSYFSIVNVKVYDKWLDKDGKKYVIIGCDEEIQEGFSVYFIPPVTIEMTSMEQFDAIVPGNGIYDTVMICSEIPRDVAEKYKVIEYNEAGDSFLDVEVILGNSELRELYCKVVNFSAN